MATLEDHKASDWGQVRVTISDVSSALGVTKSTVSRALSGYTDISESTRQRVRRMADRMGYRPLSHAQAIRTGRGKSLGLVIQMADHDSQRPFLAEFITGLSIGASAQGWTITIAATDRPEPTMDTFRSMIRDRKVDGFVLPRTLVDDPRITLLRQADVPFVMFGRSADPIGCAWHDVLGEVAMSDAVSQLIALGHRQIGFINGGMRYNYARLRHDGFVTAMQRAGLPVQPDHMREDAVTLEAGADAARAILSGKQPPTAIVCAVDMAALGVYRAADELGLRIGKDLSVVSYDGIPDGAYVTPQLSTFLADFEDSGQRLSELLIRRINGEPVEALRDTVSAMFVDRGPAALRRNWRRVSLITIQITTNELQWRRSVKLNRKSAMPVSAATAAALLATGVSAESLRVWTTEEQPERLARQEQMAADFCAANRLVHEYIDGERDAAATVAALNEAIAGVQ